MTRPRPTTSAPAEVTARDIAALVRSQNWIRGGVLKIGDDEAAALIQQYAQTFASGEVVKAIKTHGESMLATFDRVSA